MLEDSFQKKIWEDKYQYKGESFTGFCKRVASNVFPNDELYFEELLRYLKNNYIIFGGRINSNIGVEEKGLTLFNCFIESTGINPDSLEGIMDMVNRFIITLKTEGGVGFCANYLRPANTLIRKIGVTTPGSIKFLELFDKSSEIITAGSVDSTTSYQGTPFKNSIRKGATMVTMSICHPDIEEFIIAKSTPNRLTKMNMSVLVSDAFVYAVDNDMNWDLWFPDINHEKYEEEWTGDFEDWATKGYSTVVYKTLKAKDLWDLLLTSSHRRNEPGILFIDSARKMDNLYYLENSNILGTNPCVVPGSLLFTGKGIVRVGTIYDDDVSNVVVDNRQINKTGNGTTILSASSVYKTGDDENVYKVTTKAGYELTATNYHKFNTIDGEVKLSDLKIGDKLFVCSGEGGFGINGDIDIGRLVGMVTGDGTIYEGWDNNNNCTNNQVLVAFWEKDKPLAEYFKNVVNELIHDYEVKGSKDKILIVSKVLYRVFKDKGLLDSKKNIPDFVLQGTKECMIGYLQGLFQADGTVGYNDKSNTCSIRLNSSMPTLLKDVQVLLSNFGIFSRMYLRNNKGFRSLPDGKGGHKDYFCKDNYDLIIDGSSRDIFMNKIGFMLDYKNDVYKKWVNGKKLYKKEKYVTEIISIEHVGKSDVYCLTQESHNSVIFNGILTLNCAEIFGSTGTIEIDGKQKNVVDVCCLGSVNLVKFYDIKTKQFDYTKFLDSVALLTRALDNVIDISNYPLDEYRDAAKLKRKIGVGLMGVGSLMMMMDITYGDEESIAFLDDLLSKYINCLYQTSALMAKEKGSFVVYSEKIFDGGYVGNSNNLSEETIALIKKYGLRNSALSAIAPNGTASILAGNVSGGLEPVFAKEFTRWNRVEGQEKKFKYPDVHKKEWYETDYFKEHSVAGDLFLVSTDGEYRIDKNNGLCKAHVIRDYGYNLAVENEYTHTDCASELSIEQHLNVLSVFAKYVDQSSSKTINLPNDISIDEFKNLYGRLHKFGIKGCTTYREGTMVGILEATVEEKTVKEQQQEFLSVFREHTNGLIADQVSLPIEYPSRGYILHSEAKKWYIHVAFKDEAKTKPFAVFVNTNHREDNVSTFNALDKLCDLSKSVGLNGGLLEGVQNKYAYQKNPVKICRMIGFLLRHNVSVLNIVQALESVEEATVGTFVYRMKQFMSQFIAEKSDPIKCPSCGEKTLVFESGCYLCSSCGYDKCG